MATPDVVRVIHGDGRVLIVCKSRAFGAVCLLGRMANKKATPPQGRQLGNMSIPILTYLRCN